MTSEYSSLTNGPCTDGKSGRFIAELLAGLIELLGNRRGRGLIAQRDHEHRDAWARESLHPVVPAQLLHALLERLGHEILHFLSGRSGPHGGDGEGLDRERGVLGATETQERVGAREDDGDDQEQCDRSLADRQRGQVEPAHVGLLSRNGSFSHLDALTFMQEVTTDGDDRVTDVNIAANDGALAVESNEPDGPIRHGRGSAVEQPDTGPAPSSSTAPRGTDTAPACSEAFR